MNYPNSEMVNIGWFQRKMAPFINVHSDHFNNRINLQEARYLSGFFYPGENYSAAHSDTHYLLIYSAHGHIHLQE